MGGSLRADGMGVTGQRVQHQHGIAARRIQRAPRLVGDGDLVEATPALERKATFFRTGEHRKLPPPGLVPGAPDAWVALGGHASLAARNPASRSARMSSIDSMPTERRTRSGDTPVVVCSASVNCECVVDAGWMARLRTSPTLARWLNSSSPSMKRRPASAPPAIPKDRIDPPPLGRYFSCRACQGLDARPG